MTRKVGLYCFTTDLRLHDQPALAKAASEMDELICLHRSPQAWSQQTRSMSAALCKPRQTFLHQSIVELDKQLADLKQCLWIADNDPATLQSLIASSGVTDVYISQQFGWFEQQSWQTLTNDIPHLQVHSISTHTLFDQHSLPFEIEAMPRGFSGVRNKLEKARHCAPIGKVTTLPPPPTNMPTQQGLHRVDKSINSSVNHIRSEHQFIGGEPSGLKHLADYLKSGAASTYKQSRNALQGTYYSSKFSPWLANGSLSVRQVVADLKEYEASHGANESTYWIYVELLWREYFQWYAVRHAQKVYRFGGAQDKLLDHQNNSDLIDSWINGETDYPLVNACMTELRLTGFLSNRGRQIVASCLVNELAQDWRFGAAYFEQALIDYDVATNWGNWQYIAGAGPSTVNKRHFNIDKQVAQFDPQQLYTQYWLEQRDRRDQ